MLTSLGIHPFISFFVILPLVAVVLGYVITYFTDKLYLASLLSIFLPLLVYTDVKTFIDEIALFVVYVVLYTVLAFLTSYITYYVIKGKE